jgi:protein TonB
MNKPIPTRAAPKRAVVFAMIMAVAIHLSAVVIASSKHEAADTPVMPDPPPVIAIDDRDDVPTPPTEIPAGPAETSSPTEFTEAPTPVPVLPRKPAPIRILGVTHHSTSLRSNFKALAVSAPRPAYPYEARQRGLTGGGSVVVTVDPGSGVVVDAELEQSTGSQILDSAALSAFRRWRFKAGTPSKIRIPVTFTLSGARF